MDLFIIFITGLTTGGLACLAVQGGLLASVIANQKDQEYDDSDSSKKKTAAFSLKSFDQLDWMPVSIFLLAKLIAHTILGFLLGSLGSVISPNLEVRLAFQVFTAFFMFSTAMNLLDVHPFFRFVAFQSPKFLQKMIRNTSKSKALFAPAILGLMTIFIPCGVTQSMEVLAINTANPVQGALIMFSFVLGTSPLFALLGVATAKLSEGWYQKFTKFASYTLIAMAIYSINGALLVMDSPITLNRIVSPVTYFFSDERFEKIADSELSGSLKNGVQEVTINVVNNGYTPKYIKVKKDVPVKLTLLSNNVYSCASSFVFREFKIKADLDSTDKRTFTFTPTEKGKFRFACSMGMYTGIMEVI